MSSTTAGLPALFLSCLLASGCASTPKPELTIHESDKGSVYLARVENKSFQAAHPIKLEPQLVARVLHGVYVQDEPTAIGAIITTQPKNTRALSDEDVAFLAPLISTAFAQAAADQQIGFRVTSTGTPSYSTKVGAAVGSSEPPLSLAPQETTAGLLYTHGRSLHVSLTQYRHRAQKPDMIAGPNRYYPDPTGVTTRGIVFLPKEVLRPDSYQQPTYSGDPDVKTFVIDYQALASLPEPPVAVPGVAAAGVPAAAASPVQPPAATAQEVEALKKELQEIKRQLTEQQSKQDSPKKKGTATPTE